MHARRHVVVVGLLLALAWWGEARAGAETGVSIDIGRIAISQKLTPGGGYRLPTFGVRNPGTERTTYRLRVSYMEGQEARRPPADWFRLVPDELTLDPGETRPVRVTLSLPTRADPGDYEALVGPEIAPDEPGASVGAAAAARVSFTVEPATLLEAWWLRLKALFSDHGPWTWLVPALLGAGLLLWQLRRRLTISVGRRA